MTIQWKKLTKYLASKAFTWGLKKLTEQGEVKNAPERKPRSARKVH